MDNATKSRLETLLRRAQLLMGISSQPSPSSALQDVFNKICNLVFYEPGYRNLWDEPLLTQLSWLFQAKPPNPTVFGDKVADLHQRAQHVRQVNDVFFLILTRDATLEMACNAITVLAPAERARLSQLKSPDRLQAIRATEVSPSEKISAFLAILSEDIGLDLMLQESVRECLHALQDREGAGVVNALLVTPDGNGALVMPLHIEVQPGNGQIHPAVAGREDFEATFTRARLALLGRGFL